MNRYEEQARERRKAALGSGMSVWSGGVALLIVVFLIVGLQDGMPSTYFYKVGGVGAAVLLVIRQVARRLKTKGPRSARPDPKSTLNLS